VERGTKLALEVVGGLTVIGGVGYLLIDSCLVPNPFNRAPVGYQWVTCWPGTSGSAQRTLEELSAYYFLNLGNPSYQNTLHQDAVAIRAAYPHLAASMQYPYGFPCSTLEQLGRLPTGYCSAHGITD
jgi:hypothetical protein